jgi:hypothetical protein
MADSREHTAEGLNEEECVIAAAVEVIREKKVKLWEEAEGRRGRSEAQGRRGLGETHLRRSLEG